MSEVVGREMAVSCRRKVLVYGVVDVQQPATFSAVKHRTTLKKTYHQCL